MHADGSYFSINDSPVALFTIAILSPSQRTIRDKGIRTTRNTRAVMTSNYLAYSISHKSDLSRVVCGQPTRLRQARISKRPFNNDGSNTIPGPCSSSMCAGFTQYLKAPSSAIRYCYRLTTLLVWKRLGYGRKPLFSHFEITDPIQSRPRDDR